MNNKGRDVLLLIAGGYLVYQGVQLISSVKTDQPDNAMFFMIVAVVFILVGGVYTISRILAMMKAPYEEALKNQEAESDEESSTEESGTEELAIEESTEEVVEEVTEEVEKKEE